MTHDVSKLAIGEEIDVGSTEAAKAKAENDAVEEVTKATLEGIKKGEQASLKLH